MSWVLKNGPKIQEAKEEQKDHGDPCPKDLQPLRDPRLDQTASDDDADESYDDSVAKRKQKSHYLGDKTVLSNGSGDGVDCRKMV